MDGVMVRNGEVYGLAVRRADGSVCAQRLRWIVLCRTLQKAPLLRGFPVLLETVVNGTVALNRSASLTSGGMCAGFWGVAGSVALATALAVLLFVAAPHVLSLLMAFLGLSGGVEGVSFHIWDGFFKAAIFVAYVWLISLIPDIRRLFACHGAEHKAIGSWESGEKLTWQSCMTASRLHPRCGTAFVLFVVIAAMVVQAFVVPLFFHFWEPPHALARQGGVIVLKLLLIIPVSGLAYEVIQFAASLKSGLWGTMLQAPGLALQRLTTREPDPEQMQVALVALSEALGHEEAGLISTGPFIHLDAGETAPTHYLH